MTGLVFSGLCGQQQKRQWGGKGVLLYAREAAQMRLVTIFVFSWSLRSLVPRGLRRLMVL